MFTPCLLIVIYHIIIPLVLCGIRYLKTTLTLKFDNFFNTYLYSLRIESTQNSFNNSHLYINFSTYTEKIFCSFFGCIVRWLMHGFLYYSCHLMFWSGQVAVGSSPSVGVLSLFSPSSVSQLSLSLCFRRSLLHFTTRLSLDRKTQACQL